MVVRTRARRWTLILLGIAFACSVLASVALATVDGELKRWIFLVLISTGVAACVAALVLTQVNAVGLYRYYQAHPDERPSKRESLTRLGVLAAAMATVAAVGVVQGNTQMVVVGVVGVICFAVLAGNFLRSSPD